MKTIAIEVPLVFDHIGFDTDDEYDRVEPVRVAFWKDEIKSLSVFTYEHAGCSIRTTIDWAPVAARIQKSSEIWSPIYRGQEADIEAYQRLPKQTLSSVLVEITGENDHSGHPWYPRYFAELALYDAFICANIAFPGSLNLYSAHIPASGENVVQTELRLSSYNFEFWWVESLRGHFPKLRQIPLKEVREWYAISRVGGQSRAQSGLERAVFCLFHLCRSDNYIDGIIWIFHALEALLETRVGENISGMLRRISLLVEMSEREKKALKKKLKHAYDLRSAFVHGGYEVPHPLHNEVIDPTLGHNYGEALELQQFGMALILSLLQQLVRLRATKYHFREVFVPHVGAP
jgi:hypothetical protein